MYRSSCGPTDCCAEAPRLAYDRHASFAACTPWHPRRYKKVTPTNANSYSRQVFAFSAQLHCTINACIGLFFALHHQPILAAVSSCCSPSIKTTQPTALSEHCMLAVLNPHASGVIEPTIESKRVLELVVTLLARRAPCNFTRRHTLV